MTHPIEIKSIGFLIDEYITTLFKVAAKVNGADERRGVLSDVISAKLSDDNWMNDAAVIELYGMLRLCWDAQDKIMEGDVSSIETVRAARLAQTSNAERNALIRKLDEKFGDKERSPLEKTYAQDKGIT